MSEENRPESEKQKNAMTDSLGKNAYFAAVSGDFNPKGFRASLAVTVAILSMIFIAMLFTKKPIHVGKSVGSSFSVPGITRNENDISPKLLTEKDLVNVLPRTNKASSALGKIKVISLRSASELPVGSEMKATLISGATDGIVKAALTSPLVVDGESVLPEKTVLFGKGKSGEERLFISFSKAILPSGDSFSIRAEAFDFNDKIQGLKGALIGRRTKKMAGAVAFGFLGGMADGMQSTSGSYFIQQKPSARDAALAGASKAALDQSAAYMEEMKNSPNIIEVKAGTSIIIITNEVEKKE